MSKTQPKTITITTKEGQPFQVPPEGSLGLLALGHIGLLAWRQVRGDVVAQVKAAQEAYQATKEAESGESEAAKGDETPTADPEGADKD